MSDRDISEFKFRTTSRTFSTRCSWAGNLLAARYAEPADHLDHRRPADRALRRLRTVFALSARSRTEEATLREARCASARALPSISSCCKAGASRAKISNSATALPNRPKAACSSPPAKRPLIVSSCGTVTAAVPLWREVRFHRESTSDIDQGGDRFFAMARRAVALCGHPIHRAVNRADNPSPASDRLPSQLHHHPPM